MCCKMFNRMKNSAPNRFIWDYIFKKLPTSEGGTSPSGTPLCRASMAADPITLVLIGANAPFWTSTIWPPPYFENRYPWAVEKITMIFTSLCWCWGRQADNSETTCVDHCDKTLPTNHPDHNAFPRRPHPRRGRPIEISPQHLRDQGISLPLIPGGGGGEGAPLTPPLKKTLSQQNFVI